MAGFEKESLTTQFTIELQEHPQKFRGDGIFVGVFITAQNGTNIENLVRMTN